MSSNRQRPEGMLSTAELCRQSGVTYRQAQHWAMRGYLQPAVESSGSGSRRWWSPTSISEAVILRELAPFSSVHSPIAGDVVQAWREAGRPAKAWVGITSVGPWVWESTPELLEDLNSGNACLVVHVPIDE